MQLKRKQTLRAGAGLLTALSVLILGCNPASFTPGQGGNPAAPVQPADKPVVFNTLSGQAMLKGAPLKNATITVVDAVMGQSASIIAAGGGNIIAAGGGNYRIKQAGGSIVVQDGGLKTDANGNFSLQVGNMTPQSVVKVVISGEGKTITALVSGDGKAIGAQYNVQATFRFSVNERSSLLAAIAEPMLAVTGVLKDDVAEATRQTTLADVNAMIDEIEKLVQENPELVDQIITTQAQPNPGEGQPATPAKTVNVEALNTLIKTNTTLSTAISATVQKTVSSVATLAAQETNRQTTASTATTLAGTNFVGTDIKVEVSGTTVKIGDTVIEAAPVATPAPSQTSAPTQTPAPQQTPAQTPAPQQTPASTPVPVQTQAPSADGTVKSDANAFDPTLTFATTSIKVVQGQGQEDVGSVYARMLKTDVSAPGTWSNAIVNAATSTVNLAGTVKAVALANTTAAVPSKNLPSTLGSISVSDANDIYHGQLEVAGTRVATFTVYESGNYYILGVVYALTDAMKFNSGHTTTLNLSGTSLTAGKEVKYVLYSRGTNTVQGTTKIPTP